MSMLNTFSTRFTVLVALAGGAALAACGDDTKLHGAVDAKPQTFDTPLIDASPPDAGVDAMPTAQVAGTVAVTDVKLLDTDSMAAQFGGQLSGGSISMSFSDLTMNGGTVVAGTSNVNGCVVVKYDPQHKPSPLLNAGPITVANKPITNDVVGSPDNGMTFDGLNETVGPCTFVAAANTYLCISANQTNQAVTAVPNGATTAGTVILQFAGTPFTGQKLTGSWIKISGFTNTAFNVSAASPAFPILAQPAANVLVIGDAAGSVQAAPEAATGGIDYTVLNGLNPIPGGNDFLGKGGITITKTTNTGFKMFTQNIDVTGQGFTLSDPGNPTALPLTGTATDLAFGCGANTATCGNGVDNKSPLNIIQAMIISGRATKQTVPAHPDFFMPVEDPATNTWLEFQCGFIGSKSATLDAAALQAIIDFAPTRVEVRVINASGNIITDTGLPGNPQTFVLAGHALVGHTTHP